MARQSSVSLYANYDQLSKHICHSYDFPCLKFKKFYYQEIFAPHWMILLIGSYHYPRTRSPLDLLELENLAITVQSLILNLNNVSINWPVMYLNDTLFWYTFNFIFWFWFDVKILFSQLYRKQDIFRKSYQWRRRACKKAERPSMINRIATVSTENKAKYKYPNLSQPLLQGYTFSLNLDSPSEKKFPSHYL